MSIGELYLLPFSDGLQQIVGDVYTTCIRFGLKVNCAKSQVQCIGRAEQQMRILVENEEYIRVKNLCTWEVMSRQKDAA